MWRLLSISPAKTKLKKWTALFADGTRRKKVSFGAVGYRDFTLISDKAEALKAREAYRTRHAKDNLTDPLSPGALSWWILWGERQDMRANVRDYLKHFWP